MEYVKIGSRFFDVIVTELEENFNILYGEETGRTISERARMTLAPIGTFYGHKITFKRKMGKELEYDFLFHYLSEPRFDGIPVEIISHNGIMKYDAYVSQGSRALKRIDPQSGKVFWDSFSVNFIPMEAQVVPNE